MSKAKYPGVILAIDRDFIVKNFGLQQGFTPVVSADAQDLLEQMTPHLVLKQRTALETDPRFLQLLPYVCIKQQDHNDDGKSFDGIMMYRRTKKVGEQRLAGNTSIGLGGHIELEDIVFDGDAAFDLSKILTQNLWRELREELKGFETIPSSFEIKFSFKGFITDYANEVGNVHIALVYEVVVPHASKLIIGEDELEQVGFLNFENFVHPTRFEQVGDFDTPDLIASMEPWSKILHDYIQHTEGTELTRKLHDPQSTPNCALGSTPVAQVEQGSVETSTLLLSNLEISNLTYTGATLNGTLITDKSEMVEDSAFVQPGGGFEAARTQLAFGATLVTIPDLRLDRAQSAGVFQLIKEVSRAAIIFAGGSPDFSTAITGMLDGECSDICTRLQGGNLSESGGIYSHVYLNFADQKVLVPALALSPYQSARVITVLENTVAGVALALANSFGDNVDVANEIKRRGAELSHVVNDGNDVLTKVLTSFSRN
jgi:predicted NUDIX family phosphoesterase